MEDYVKIYEECLNRSYHNEKLETIISCLYDIVNHYDKAIKEDSNASTMEDYKKHYSNIRRSIMEDLLIIFNIIIEKNNYKDLNEVIAFAFELNIDWAFINDYLNVIYNLENFDKENSIPYRIDKSNYKDKYTRNRYRKYVLPFLKKEEENVHSKFLNFSESLIACDKLLDKLTTSSQKSKLFTFTK